MLLLLKTLILVVLALAAVLGLMAAFISLIRNGYKTPKSKK